MDTPNSFQVTTLALFASLVLLYYALLRKKNKSTKSTGVQAPEPAGAWPIIGHLHLLGGRDQLLYRTLGAMADKYGPAFNVRHGSRRAFVVNSWEVAKECFTANDKALASRPTTVATKHMGYNYAAFGFAPYTPFWREMRKIATFELLSNRRLEMLKHVRISEIDTGILNLYDSCKFRAVELNRWFDELTLNMTVRMVAGKSYFGASAECDGDEAQRCQKAMSQFFHRIGIGRASVSVVAGFAGTREGDEEDGQGVGRHTWRVAGGASEEEGFSRGHRG